MLEFVYRIMPNTRSTKSVTDLAKQFSFNSGNKSKLSHSESVIIPENNVLSDAKENKTESTSDNKNKGSKRKVTIKREEHEISGLPHLKKDKWMPENWELVLNNIREMRKNMDAPVDTMGCDVSHDLNLSPEIRRYQVLVSLMLSSQTKDEVNFAAMNRLREHGLTVENILNTSEETFGKLIYPVGFWKTKAKNIKKATQILKDDYNSDIPNSVETLCKLPGVGPKMAHLAMNVGWGIVTGIGVDTHVHRISNRLGWVRKETKTPESTRQELEAWLPRDLWKEVNHILVGFGQTKCRPINPDCNSCLNKDICPASSTKKGGKIKSPRK